MLKPKPDIYDNIFAFGSSPSQDEASVGGWIHRPDLALSYLLAARHVIERGQQDRRLNEIALPAAYLQRHSLELELKGCIEAAYEIEKDSKWLDLLSKDPEAPPPTKRCVQHNHSHKELLVDLLTALKDVGAYVLPECVIDLCDRLAAVEADAPERFRYGMVRFGKDRKKPLEPAFDEQETLKIVETQNRMEDVFQQVFKFDKAVMEPWEVMPEVNLGTELSYECYALSQILVQNYPSTYQ